METTQATTTTRDIVITVPVFINNGQREDWTFDTTEFRLTEQNLQDQEMKIAHAHSQWSLVLAWYKNAILNLDNKRACEEARDKAIAQDGLSKRGIKLTSETAKKDALYTYQDGQTYPFAERVLMYENKRAELQYYQDIVANAILKSLDIEKDMLITLSANDRARYRTTVNTIN